MSAHIFDPEVAKQVGVNAAVIYQNIVFWCEKNAANGKHIYEGRAWTYNSVKAFSDMFPYLSADQIRRALEKLEQDGFIGVGSFSEDARDRTKWFCDLRQMHLANLPTSFGTDANSYKDTDVNTDINNRYKGAPDGAGLFDAMEEPEARKVDRAEEFWEAYPKCKRKLDRADVLITFRKIVAGKHPKQPKTDAETIIAAVKRFALSGDDPDFMPNPVVWLNKGRWEGYPEPVKAATPIRWTPGGIVR